MSRTLQIYGIGYLVRGPEVGRGFLRRPLIEVSEYSPASRFGRLESRFRHYFSETAHAPRPKRVVL